MPGSKANAKKATYGSLSADDLVALCDKEEVIVVDVRTAPERRVASLNGSVSRADFERLDDEALRGKTVVAICTVGKRSGDFAESLGEGPWREVLNSEGIVPYSHHPLATEGKHGLVDGDGKPASSLHVFASPWDLGSDRFTPVTFGLWHLLLAVFAPNRLDDS